MKVLLCERSSSGHRMLYLRGLTNISDIEFFSYAPENVELDKQHFFLYESANKRKLSDYLKWIRKIKTIVKENQIDVVHILDGDSIMKFFGLGFSGINAKRIVITYHHMFEGFLRRLSYKAMNQTKKAISVVHTTSIQHQLKKILHKSVELCQYPAFNFEALSTKNSQECKAFFGLQQDIPVIGIIGGMNRYKNIIEFLKTMNNCKKDFQILLCGKPGDITEQDICEMVKMYPEKVRMLLRMLSEDEYEKAMVASDIIFCVYGHEFDGASGPLTDGVCAEKMIFSCKHGSLGKIVKENHLGYVAEVDDEAEVLKTAEEVLDRANSFQYDERAIEYKNNLKPDKFFQKYKTIYGKV